MKAHFDKAINGKKTNGDTGSYINAINKIKKFIDGEYGGVEVFINLSDDALRDKFILNSTAKTSVNKAISPTSIPRPCSAEIDRYLLQWDSWENAYMQESALDKLFLRTYPSNTALDDILIKVSVLNDFYSTNIYDPFRVAKHVLDLNIDGRLQASDASLVNDIAKVTMANGVVKNFYSFATKYCSRHNPKEFPIYDSYVDRLLRYFRKADGFACFSSDELRIFATYKNVLIQFRSFYNLESYNLKEIDKYLWQLGKEKFPQQYK